MTYAAIGVIAALGLFALALPLFVSSDLVRNAVKNEITSFVGRQVLLDGDVRLTLFPTPVLHFSDISIPSDNGDDAPILTIEKAQANIALFTLLSSTPQFTGFKLDRPHLSITRSDDGTIQWTENFSRIERAKQLAERAISSTGDASNETTVPLLPNDFPQKLGAISFTNGSIDIKGYGAEETIEITALEGDVNWPRIEGQATSNVKAVWRGQPVTSTIAIENPLAILAGDQSQISIDANMAAGALSYDGVAGFIGDIFAAGDISISTSSMSSLLDFLRIDVSAGRAIGTMSLTGNVQIDKGTAQIDASAINLDDNAGTGVFEISADDDAPISIAGTMDFDTLNIGSFINAFFKIPNAPFSANYQPDTKFMSELHSDLRLSATTAQLGDIALNNLAAIAQINDQNAIFELGDAEAFNGNIQARLKFSAEDQKQKQMHIGLSASNIDTALLSETLNLPNLLPLGIGNISLSAQTPLSTWSKMTSNAKGSVSLKMAEGITRGFGVQALLANEAASQFFTLVSSDNTDETFNALIFEGDLVDGIITTQNAQITYPEGIVTLDGVTPFRSGGIALTATATPNQATPDIKERRFFIGGSWNRAFATPLLLGVAPQP